MTAPLYHQKSIQHAFSRAAEHYDTHATLQHEVLQRAFMEAVQFFPQRAEVLDIGCGTGRFAALSTAAEWKMAQLDIAFGMCKKALPYASVINADAHALPVATGVFDAVFSNLAFQWFSQPAVALGEMHRMLKKQGKCLITGFSFGTLHELKHAFATVDNSPRFNIFFSQEEVERMAAQAGFRVVKSYMQKYKKYYASMEELLKQIKSIGASNKITGRAPGTRNMFHMVATEYEKYRQPEGLPASWEVVYLALEK